MATNEGTYLDPQCGVDLIMDDIMVSQVVDVFKELHVEEKNNLEFVMAQFVMTVHDKIAADILKGEIEREEMEAEQQGDIVYSADILSLVDAIENRKKTEEITDKVKNISLDEESGLPTSQLTRWKVLATASTLDIESENAKIHIYRADAEMPTNDDDDDSNDQNEDKSLELQPNPDCRSKHSAGDNPAVNKGKSKAKKNPVSTNRATSRNHAPVSTNRAPVSTNPAPVSTEPPPMVMLNEDELNAYVEGQKSKNTVKRTKQVVFKSEDFMATYYLDGRPMYTLDAHTLNNYVCNYLISAKRQDGTPYEPDTLTSILRALDRHLKDKKYPYSLLIDAEFEACRSILISRRKELKSMGKGGRPNRSEAITEEQIEILWTKDVFGAQTPRSLQNTIYYYFTCGFGFRGCHESRQLQWGDVLPGADQDGQRYLQLECERLTKTRQGLEGGHTRPYNPRVYEDADLTRDPLTLYELFTTKRPTDMRSPTAPFYLTPLPQYRPEDEFWYKSSPMGINMLSAIVPRMAEEAGLVGKITNHSLCRTTCQNLLVANLPSTATIQLTGHKSVDSLNNYAVATKRQQKDMALIATGQKRSRPAEALGIAPASLSTHTVEAMDNAPTPATAMYTPTVEAMVTAPTPAIAIAAPKPAARLPSPASALGIPGGPTRMDGLISAANGMFAGANIGCGVTINFNFQPQTGNVHAQNVDLDIANTQN